jgi:hypothetical protein
VAWHAGRAVWHGETAINEADEDETPKESGNDSIDRQIDRYFADYESEAKSVKNEGKDWRRTVRRIVEADEDTSDLSDSGLDIASFTNSIVRLVENYDSLLEVRNTILRRSANFLGKNYDQSVVNEFMDNLKEDHGIVIGKSPEDVAEDEFPAPAAARAGEGGGGAVG